MDWHPYNIPGINSEVMCHKLHINPTTKPIKQKPRIASPKKAKAVEEELLNFPFYNFPLPRIEQLADLIASYGRMSFLNAYSGYQQIPMFGTDQENTTFITTLA